MTSVATSFFTPASIAPMIMGFHAIPRVSAMRTPSSCCSFLRRSCHAVGASGVDLGLFLAAFCDGVLSAGQHIVVDVANGDDVYVIAAEQEAEVALAAEGRCR